MEMERSSTKVRCGWDKKRLCVELGWESKLTMLALEFRVFVEETEGQLWTLFNKIDRDGNGRIDKNELKAAFQRANLSVPPKKLDRFVEEFDRDGSGVITFDEWR